MATFKRRLFATLWLFLTIQRCYSEDTARENLEVIEVPAFGRVAQLGEFYDATEEQFLNQIIFGKRLPPSLELITSLDNPSTDTRFQVVETMSQKLTFLGIAASLAVSLKCASFNVDVKGSASFVKDEKQSARHVEGFLVHSTQTSRDSVDLFYEGIRPYVDVTSLSETTASHIVTGVYYGADVAARFTDTNVLNHDMDEIKGKLEIAFSLKELLTVEAMAEVNITNENFGNFSTYDLQVSGDIPMNIIPTNSFEVLQFIQTIPALLADINGGKGKPIRYILTPVKLLEEAYAIEIQNAKIVNTIDEAILQNILFTFDDIGKTRQKLNDLQELFQNYMDRCLTPSIKKSLDILSNNFDVRAGNFTVDVRKGLVKARGNATAMGELQDILTAYSVHPDYPSNVNVILDHEFEDGKRKIQFYESFREHNVQYLTESAYESSLINTNASVVYVFFYNLSLVEAESSAWEEGTHVFFGQLKRPGTQLKVVDCDFPLGDSHCTQLKKSEIHSFINNKRVSSDVLSDFFSYTRSEPITLPSFSHSNLLNPEATYELGQLFDRKSQGFLQEFIITKTENSSALEMLIDDSDTVLQKMQCEIISPSYKAMFMALHIHPMFHVPILLKNVTLQGSAQIFSFPQDQYLDRLNLVCERRSGQRSIKVNEESIVKVLDFVSLIDRPDATHFIQSTEYTGTTIVTMETVKSSGSTEELRSKLHSIKSKLENDGADSEMELEPDLTGFEVAIYSDIFPKSQVHPKTWKETVDVLKVIENAFEDDETQGLKVYNLYPVTNLQLGYGIISEKRMDPAMTFVGLLDFANYFDQLAALKFNVNNEISFLRESEECTPTVYMNEIDRLESQFEGVLASWIQNLKRAYPEFYVSGDTSELEKVLEDTKAVTSTGEDTLAALRDNTERLSEARMFYKIAKASSYEYITSESMWSEAFYEAVTKRAYFLFYRFDWMESFEDAWIENFSTFLSRFKDDSLKTYIVDCSFFTDSFVCQNVSQPVIHEYKDGILDSEDVVEKLKAEEGGDEERQKELREALIKHEVQENARFEDISENLKNATDGQETIALSLKNLISELERNVNESTGSIPPLYYVYIQYGDEKRPQDMWNGSKRWLDVSTMYPGQQGKFWKYGY